MKKFAAILSLLLSLLLAAGCAESAESECTAPETSGAEAASGQVQQAEKTEQALSAIKKLGESPDDNYRVWYQILVGSYCDSNADGVGDLNGVRSKLDELEQLGVNGLWLMPIHPSPSYHKYNVSDYYAIDPAYGTLEDFDALISECNARGIRVILDLVVNHSGSDHAWFQTACAYLAQLPAGEEPDAAVCPEAEYYNFRRAESCPAGFHAVPGAEGWFYEGRFSPEMPDLNLGSEALREEIRRIMAFWLGRGVAGFRVDAAKEFYSGRTEENIEVLRWLQETAEELNPACYLVAEVWDSFASIADYYESGISSIFNYPFGDSGGKIIKVLQGAGNESVVQTWASAQQKADEAYRRSNPGYIDAPFLSNHDVGRIAGFVGRNPEKTKLAGAMNLFMGGSAFVYYGEEIGMVCGAVDDPSYRAPMHWTEEANDETPQPPPGCKLPEAYPMGSLEQQKTDDSSVYNYYRQAIAIRRALPVISHGVPTVEQALNRGCVSAVRKTWGEQSCMILMNIDEAPAEAELAGYSDWTLAAALSADGAPVTLEGEKLTLPAFATAILVPGR